MSRYPIQKWCQGAWARLVLVLTACAAPAAAPATPPSGGTSDHLTRIASPPASGPPAAREALRIPYSAISLSSLPHWLAYDAGYYAEEGLDVTLEYISSSTTLAPALLSGEIPVAYAGQEIVIASGVRGGDLVIIGAGLERPLFWLSVQGSERTPEELRGKRIGVTRFGSSSDVVLRAWLATVGLVPERDVTILQSGGTPEMVSALQAGGLDAAVLSPPAVFQAQRNGAVPIVDLGDLDLPFYQSALVTTRRFLSERPETARRVARAFARAWPLLHDEAAALASLRRHADGIDDELLGETYRAGVRRFAGSPLPRVEPLRRGLEQLAAREGLPAGVTPEQFIAPEVMRAALTS
ncbi:MAG TPA: ABC transporter substrate-binding protein [Chloroflexota bacterium]|nr:ABC transporter substrate-binding protein [Chloroflexota bacterium]